MKKILITLAFAMTSVAAAMAADVWLPGLNPDPSEFKCRCHVLINNECLVTNPHTVCASGKNPKCWEYNYKCKW